MTSVIVTVCLLSILRAFEHCVTQCLHQQCRALAAMCQGGHLMQTLHAVTPAHNITLAFVLYFIMQTLSLGRLHMLCCNVVVVFGCNSIRAQATV